MTTLQADDIAHYLVRHQDFFEQHPQLLSQMQLPHPHDGQAISLVERQSLMLRERVKALEGRIAEMVRHGQENDAIAEKLICWVRSLLIETEDAALPATLSGQATVAAPAAQSAGTLHMNSYYTCSGERVAVLRCRSDADDGYCSVQYPDRKSAATAA